jgi:hypothetical protein
MTTEHIRKLVSHATDKLIADLEAGKSEQLRAYLAAIGRFHRYSLGNVLLIWSQRPTATHVAGFHTWRQLGRQVRKGEKGIRILAPIVRRLANEDRNDEDDKVVAFRAAYVFDASQTDGKPLPEFAAAQGDPGDHHRRLCEFLKKRGIRVECSSLPGSVQGMSMGGKIVVRNDLAPAEHLSVTLHEAAHELLNHRVKASEMPKTVRETEAEAVAFTVCQAIGLDCGTASCDYIKLYGGKKETLLASLERIRSVAAEIIGALSSEDSEAKQPAAQESPPMASAA